MIIRGGDGKPKGEIIGAPEGSPPSITMNRHNRRKFVREQLKRVDRKAGKKHG